MELPVSAARPFCLDGAFGRWRWAERAIEQVSGLARLQREYASLEPSAGPNAFLAQVLDRLRIDYRVPDSELSHIPLQGGVVVVANHPYGALDGMVLAHLLGGLRSDVRILANSMLGRIPELSELFLGVDPYAGPEAHRRNLAPLRDALRWLQGGGLLLVFPAGEVAHLDRRGAIGEAPWSPTVARLARRAGVPAVPIYLHGRNSLGFQLAGLLHPRLRTALLARELLNKAGRTVTLRIGAAVGTRQIAEEADDGRLINLLRMRTLLLGDLARPARTRNGVREGGQPLAPPPPVELLQEEVAQLPPEQLLTHNGVMEVWYARAAQIPHLLQEIGRLRELTFREAGEGTGKACDIDLYDSYYLHLFVWNTEQRELVGAYRLGLVDQILPRYGKHGLYTHSLFRYRRRLIEQLPPSIELGRSFVQPDYQRSFSPLLLLWKGIGAFVVRHPRYRILLGPVSISNDYHALSRQLMVAFLRDNLYLPELARHVQPRRPFRGMGRRWHSNGYAHLADIEALSGLISQIEGGEKGAPILLRQYLKLGGRVLGFNVDRQFSDALDGLVMVDLCQTESKMLARYMGPEAAQRYLEYHRSAKPLRHSSLR